MSNGQIKYSVGPFIVLVFIFFIIGFLTTVNGQFQGPLQIAFLSKTDHLRNTLTVLITFFFFLGYLLTSGIASVWINNSGYKATLVRSLFIMFIGLLTYSLSAWMGSNWPDAGINLGEDRVPWAYFVFLIGCFLLGTSAAMIQVVVNPYVASYELPGTSTIQRMNIATGINSVGTTIAPFFVSAVIFAGIAITSVHPGQLLTPILCIAGVVFLVALYVIRMTLPDLASTRSTVALPRSVWSFSHLALGVITIFIYVGAEVAVGQNINMYALQMIERGNALSFLGSDSLTIGGINLGIPALLATLYWGGMMVGRLTLTGFPGVSPRWLLASVTAISAVLVLLAMFFDNLYILASLGLFHSVMWSCIFTLAMAGLAAYTSKAAGAFMMGVFGGAVIPLGQAILADMCGSWRWTWLLVFICEIFMLWYALWGSKVKDSEALANLEKLAPADPG